MSLRNAHISLGAIVSTALLLATPASAQQLFLDDFNTETLGTNAVSITNWNISSGNIDVIGNPGFFEFYPGNGRYLDMDGSTSNAGRIETITVFNLTPGDYTLSFDQGKNGSSAESMNISVGSVFTNLFSSPAGSVPALINREFNFTVGAATTGTIVFDHLGNDNTSNTGDNAGIVVDNVRLVRIVTTVPEPSALALLLPIMGVFGVAMVRRNKK